MNYVLNNIPVRTQKPRTTGFTMAMDKGLSLRETEDFVDSCSDFVDIVKLGWATSYVTKHLDKKIAIYREAGIPVYLGGTLRGAEASKFGIKSGIKVAATNVPTFVEGLINDYLTDNKNTTNFNEYTQFLVKDLVAEEA